MYLIAEIGTNHNGDHETAVKLVESAINAGVDAIKMSLIEADQIALKSSPQWKRFKYLELAEETFEVCTNLAHAKGVDVIIAPFGVDLVPKAIQWADKLKIASGELTNDDLLKACHQSVLPCILSTGMADVDEICHAVEILKPEVVMHCVSLYPTKDNEANLRRITRLNWVFDVGESSSIGYSDHTRDIFACVIACALGATTIEKHFNIAGNDCVDKYISCGPDDFRRLRLQLRRVEAMLKVNADFDLVNRAKLRRGPSGLRGDYRGNL